MQGVKLAGRGACGLGQPVPGLGEGEEVWTLGAVGKVHEFLKVRPASQHTGRQAAADMA